MSKRPARSLIRSAIGPAIALFVIAYFAGAAIVGPNGLTSLAGYRHQRAVRLAQLQSLQATRDRLAHHAGLLDPHHVDPDYADELIRRQTGQIRPDEVILPGN
ncbi:FtsB family cell division protein [Sphingomonas nostoxanthinifaciens]|uniref:FtsB family cell division protein n=1 Tax=Sphingomonas nostoxanthinifaciens TaxID=2872652 RepID=UPI001CC1F6B5|nr:septum formation initiator family protein [Sphingomonas nostoxanthinifaciens]UAK25330.1 septum formation initiator family protein [Sphingomonas nostoxanthinifaciens]